MPFFSSDDPPHTHPGEALREDVLPTFNMPQAQLAKGLGASRLSVSELLRGKRAVLADIPVRVANLISNTAESWRR